MESIKNVLLLLLLLTTVACLATLTFIAGYKVKERNTVKVLDEGRFDALKHTNQNSDNTILDLMRSMYRLRHIKNDPIKTFTLDKCIKSTVLLVVHSGVVSVENARDLCNIYKPKNFKVASSKIFVACRDSIKKHLNSISNQNRHIVGSDKNYADFLTQLRSTKKQFWHKLVNDKDHEIIMEVKEKPFSIYVNNQEYGVTSNSKAKHPFVCAYEKLH